MNFNIDYIMKHIHESAYKRLFNGITFSIISEISIIEFPQDELIIPDSMKLSYLNDMKRLGYKITRKFLNTYGFYDYEINWLIQNGEVIEND